MNLRLQSDNIPFRNPHIKLSLIKGPMRPDNFLPFPRVSGYPVAEVNCDRYVCHLSIHAIMGQHRADIEPMLAASERDRPASDILCIYWDAGPLLGQNRTDITRSGSVPAPSRPVMVC